MDKWLYSFLPPMALALVITILYLVAFETNDIKIEKSIAGSCEVLASAISQTDSSIENIGDGFLKSSPDFEVDEATLIRRFYSLLRKNEPEKVVESIAMVAVVQEYELSVYDPSIEQWLPPMFFTYEAGSHLYYLSPFHRYCYYYDGSNVVSTTIGAAGISDVERQSVVIEKINERLGAFAMTNGDVASQVKILNTANSDQEYWVDNMSFNPLDGFTMFVLYQEGKRFISGGTFKPTTRHAVVGVTLNY